MWCSLLRRKQGYKDTHSTKQGYKDTHSTKQGYRDTNSTKQGYKDTHSKTFYKLMTFKICCLNYLI